MFKRWANRLFWATGLAVSLGISTNHAWAQPQVDPGVLERLEKLEKQNELLQKQNEQLQKVLQSRPESAVSTGLDKADVQNIVSEYLKGIQDGKKDKDGKEVKDPWYQVGTDLKMSATWKNGVVFSTPHNDFSLHVGGWIQWDNVWWDQSVNLQKPPGLRVGKAQGVNTGIATGGIGDMQDGTFFRRERIMLDGKFWENYEYTLVFAHENGQFNTSGLDEFWVGATNIPLIGTIRLGHVKNALGLEADMASSSRTMTFLERSSYSEAIGRNENFVTGAWFGNNYWDQRATWTFVAFRNDAGSSTGALFDDGAWGWQGRLTALPIYENDGRCLMHVGLSGGWRNGVNVLGGPRLFQLRARPELRDDVPAGGFQNGDSNRFVDTSALIARHDWLAGLEYLYVRGPLSLQAEYGWNWIQNVTGSAPALANNPNFAVPQNFMFSGGYIQLAYTLTGENRSYDKRLGRLDSYYFGRKGPYTNAFFVRGEDGKLNWGLGAWELAARYSYINLNDGTGLNRVAGGNMEGLTLGVNWYLNDNLKFQFDYVYDHRYNLPAGATPGYTAGLGLRMQFMY